MTFRPPDLLAADLLKIYITEEILIGLDGVIVPAVREMIGL